MAITLPKIQRNESVVNEGSIGRAQVDLSGLYQADMKRTEIIANASQKALSTFSTMQQEKKKLDTSFHSDKLINEVSPKIHEEVQKFLSLPDGIDVTSQRQQLEKNIQEIQKSYLTNPSVSEDVKALFQEKLSKLNSGYAKQIITKSISADASYRATEYSKRVDFLTSDISTNAITTDFNKPESVAILNDKMAEIKRISTSVDNANYKNADKVMAKAVEKPITDLLSQGLVDKAEALYNLYGADVLGDLKSTTLKKIKDAKDENMVYGVAEKAKSLPQGKGLDYIAKNIPDLENRQKAVNLLNSYHSNLRVQDEYVKRQKAEALLDQVEKEKADGRVFTQDDMSPTSKLGSELLNLKSSQADAIKRKALRTGALVTNVEAWNKLDRMANTGEIAKLPKVEYEELASQLTPSARQSFDRQRNDYLDGKKQKNIKVENNFKQQVKARIVSSMYNNELGTQNSNHYIMYVAPIVEQKLANLTPDMTLNDATFNAIVTETVREVVNKVPVPKGARSRGILGKLTDVAKSRFNDNSSAVQTKEVRTKEENNALLESLIGDK